MSDSIFGNPDSLGVWTAGPSTFDPFGDKVYSVGGAGWSLGRGPYRGPKSHFIPGPGRDALCGAPAETVFNIRRERCPGWPCGRCMDRGAKP